MTAHAFTTSDLARRRKDVLAAARTGTAMVRDTDGAVFAVLPAEHVVAANRIAELHGTLRSLVAAARTEHPAASALGEAAWASDWPIERRWTLINDLTETLALAESLGDPAPAIGLLEASRPRPRQTVPFDATIAFKALSDEDQSILRGERRSPRPQ